jgi:AraC family transcriptional regulator
VPEVRIVAFPATRVAAITHLGPPSLEHQTVARLIQWKLEHRLLDAARYRSYGVHYTDPRTTPPEDHRVDFCLSIDIGVAPNALGIVEKLLPANRCALSRDIGSRHDNRAAVWLYEEWLPHSGERPARFPIFFHYVNVGPGLRAEELVTDVYLPLN